MVGKTHNPETIWPVPEEYRDIYAHAVEIPPGVRLLLLSGQVGIRPDGTLPNDFAEQCEQAFANIQALLHDAQMTTSDIVKITYYLVRAEDLPTLNRIRRERSSGTSPAVTTLIVAALAKPDLLIEIEVYAAAK